jgi:hypothetical protein
MLIKTQHGREFPAAATPVAHRVHAALRLDRTGFRRSRTTAGCAEARGRPGEMGRLGNADTAVVTAVCGVFLAFPQRIFSTTQVVVPN